MLQRLKLLLLLVLIPLLCLIAVQITRSTMQTNWVEAVVAQVGAQPSEIIPLAEVCQDPETRSVLAEPCSALGALNLIQNGVWATLAIGLLLPVIISLAGRQARNQRELLWRIFRPVLRLTLIGTALIVALQATLFGASAWYLFNWGMERIDSRMIFFVFIVVAGAAYGLYAMARALLGALKEQEGREHAHVVTREQEPALWAFVDRLASRMGTEPPQQILLGLQPTFYVTESPLLCQEKHLTGRTLYLSLPFCHALTEAELAAIIGHELGHFHGEDTLFSQRFYPIYRNAEASLIALHRARGGDWRQGLALLPAVYLLAHFLDAFATAESEISRTREFAADAAGAQLTSNRAMASALVKVHAFAPQWGQVWEGLTAGLKGGEPVANASHLYVNQMIDAAEPSALDGLDEQEQPHPVDSHPPLSQRLGALQITLAEVSVEALDVQLAEPASRLIAGAAAIEESLTGEVNDFLIRSGRVSAAVA